MIKIWAITFFVDLLEHRSGEGDAVELRDEVLVKTNDCIIGENDPARCHLAWVHLHAWLLSDLKKLKLLEHEGFQVLRHRVIIYLHIIFDLFDCDSVVRPCRLIKEHYYAHLKSAHHTIVLFVPLRELSLDDCAAEGVTPLDLPMMMFVLIILLEVVHGWH